MEVLNIKFLLEFPNSLYQEWRITLRLFIATHFYYRVETTEHLHVCLGGCDRNAGCRWGFGIRLISEKR